MAETPGASVNQAPSATSATSSLEETFRAAFVASVGRGKAAGAYGTDTATDILQKYSTASAAATPARGAVPAAKQVDLAHRAKALPADHAAEQAVIDQHPVGAPPARNDEPVADALGILMRVGEEGLPDGAPIKPDDLTAKDGQQTLGPVVDAATRPATSAAAVPAITAATPFSTRTTESKAFATDSESKPAGHGKSKASAASEASASLPAQQLASVPGSPTAVGQSILDTDAKIVHLVTEPVGSRGGSAGVIASVASKDRAETATPAYSPQLTNAEEVSTGSQSLSASDLAASNIQAQQGAGDLQSTASSTRSTPVGERAEVAEPSSLDLRSVGNISPLHMSPGLSGMRRAIGVVPGPLSGDQQTNPGTVESRSLSAGVTDVSSARQQAKSSDTKAATSMSKQTASQNQPSAIEGSDADSKENSKIASSGASLPDGDAASQASLQASSLIRGLDTQVADLSRQATTTAQSTSTASKEKAGKRTVEDGGSTATSPQDLSTKGATAATSTSVVDANKGNAVSAVPAAGNVAVIPAAHLPAEPQRAPVHSGLATAVAGPRTVADRVGGQVLSAGDASMMAVSSESHRTLLATPTSLEVGMQSGTQGWLKIRAEVGGQGEVKASLDAASTGGRDLLHSQLPALNAFLHSEQLSVTASLTERGVAPESGTGTISVNSNGTHSGQGSGTPHGSLLQGGGSQGQGSPSGARQQTGTDLSEMAQSYNALEGLHDSASASSGLQTGSQGVASGQTGRWLNVRV